jgi:hypothetical protein
MVDALGHNESDPKNLIPAYALLSRVRLSSSSEVLAAAEEVVRETIAAYSRPNLTALEIESMAMRGDGPLRKFSEICREELAGMQRHL